MDITPILAEGAQRITAYGAGEFKINNEIYRHAIILHPDKVEKWESPAINQTIIEQLPSCEIVLIGCGEKAEFVTAAFRQEVKQATGAGIEVMNTGAACRTYNVLLAEGRQLVALLIPV